MVAFAVLAAACAGVCGCGDDDVAQAAEPEPVDCVQVRLESVRLERDPACAIADHPLTQTKLADLAFNPAAGLCFRIGPAAIEFANGDGEIVAASATVFSGIVTNPIADAAIAPIGQPCDAERPVLVFTAATVAEFRATDGGELVGQLVLRDTGWAEINPETVFPGFVSERLVITAGQGGVFEEVVGELLLTGDEFTGVPAMGSMCGPRLFERLREQFT